MKLDIWNKTIQSLALSGERGSVLLVIALLGDIEALYCWHNSRPEVTDLCNLPYLERLFTDGRCMICPLTIRQHSKTDSEAILVSLYKNRKK